MATNAKRGRKPKYIHTILLTGINARDLYKRVKGGTQIQLTPIIEYSPIQPPETPIENETTQLHEISDTKRTSNVLLEPMDSKMVLMQDHVNCGYLPDRTDVWCGHCRHPFDTSPIGVPIKYVKKKVDKIQPKADEVTGTNDYFLTSGIFCSFPCCLAFIKDHNHNPLYKNSKSLLYSLYYKIYHTEMNIQKAPSWEILQVYGGELSIKDYRERFCTHSYKITPNIKRPYMVAVGKWVEKKRCGYL